MLILKNFIKVLITATAGIIFCPSFLLAGDSHQYINLMCSDCHIMHYSKQHDYNGTFDTDPTISSGGPFPSLLKATPGDLCLSCHDGKTDAPDVYGADASVYLRSAGALNKVGDSGLYAEINGHSLGSTSIAPGGTWNSSAGLSCLDCHDVHGNSYYRNLKPDRGGANSVNVTYATSTSWITGVMIVQSASAPMSAHYDVSNIRYGIDAGKTLSDWCSGCHTSVHGAPGSANMGGSGSGDTPDFSGNEWLRHPAAGITMGIARANGHVDTNHWLQISGAGALRSRVPVVTAAGIIPADDNQPFCGSCHKAHGSTYKAGLLLDNDQTPAKEDGTKPLDTCQQCHYE